MNFRQMERYYSVIDLIDRYKVFLRQADSGISARSIDSVYGHSNADPRKIERQVINREKLEEKLRQLIALADQQRPEVESTIRSAVSQVKKDKIRVGLILRMRYLNGRSWEEVSSIVGLTEKELTQRIAIILDKGKVFNNESMQNRPENLI